MTYWLSDPSFPPLVLKKLKERLSGTTVMSVEQADMIRRSIEVALEKGKEGNLTERYDQGIRRLTDQVEKLRGLYDILLANYQSFGIESLEESVKEIGHFFTHYDPVFEAAEVDQVFLDYQLAEAVPKDLVGVEFYTQYVKNLTAEVLFLKYFPEEQIYELLEVYQEKLGFDYRKDINNLFEWVFKQYVGKLLTGKSENDTLLLSELEAEYAYYQLQTEGPFLIFQPLFQKDDYYHRTFLSIQYSARRLAEPERARSFFLMKQEGKMQLEIPPMMPERQFHSLMTAYSKANEVGKRHLIATHITSPADLEEYLHMSDESREFYNKLFKELDTALLKVLLIVTSYNNRLSSTKGIVGLTANSLLEVLLKDWVNQLSDSDAFSLFAECDMYQLISTAFD